MKYLSFGSVDFHPSVVTCSCKMETRFSEIYQR